MKLGLVKSSVCVAAVSLLAACAPFGKQSPLDETTVYPLPQGQSAATAQDGWWMKLKDKKLNNLIASAIQTSTNLRVVKARFEQAQAQLGVVGAANKPQVGLGVTGIGTYVSPKPQAGMVDTDHTLVLAHAALQGSLVFDFWGKNREQIQAVLGKSRAAVYEAHHIRTELAHAVAAQYFAWQMATEQLALLDTRIELADKALKLMQQRVKAQLAPADALHALEMAQQQLQLEKSAWTQKNEKIRNSLAVLTGRVPGALNGQVPEKMAAVPSLPVSRIEADLLAARPDIAAQKALLEEKWHIVKSTEAEFYPNIELKVLAGMTHIDAFNLIRGRTSGMLGIVPALNLPLFTSGALQSKLAGKRAQYNEQVAVYDQTVLNAMRSAADAVVDYQSLKSRQDTWNKMVNIADKSVQNAKGRVRAGLDNGLTALQKQDEAARTKMSAVQYHAEYLTAWSNLNAQLGGGFKLNKE